MNDINKNDPDSRFTTEIFDSREAAEQAYDHAIKQGYTDEQINVLMSDDTRKKYYGSTLVKEEVGDKSMEGLAIGGAMGGVIGGTLAAIAAIGTNIVFPGLGLVLAGPLVAGMAGAGVGSISGGLLGALVGWGIPEERAKIYERGIKSGGVVLGVNEPVSSTSRVEDNWKQNRSTTYYKP